MSEKLMKVISGRFAISDANAYKLKKRGRNINVFENEFFLPFSL
jgi:hypothetical protein